MDALPPLGSDRRDRRASRSRGRRGGDRRDWPAVEGVSKTFRRAGIDVPALVGVDLQLFDGETLGLVGESGSGKSTLAETILGIEGPDAGAHRAREPRSCRPAQRRRPRTSGHPDGVPEPDSALNRGWSVRHILARSVSKLTGLRARPSTIGSTSWPPISG
jgi:ABC-type glutathione transport system ATPase component